MKSGYKKIEGADKISRQMNPLINRSHSFHVFWDGLSEIIK
jgi:hypothetical protein